MSGTITSALIIAVCLAGVHSLAKMQAAKAAQWGVPYWQPWRVALVGGIAAIAAIYALVVTLILVFEPGQ